MAMSNQLSEIGFHKSGTPRAADEQALMADNLLYR